MPLNLNLLIEKLTNGGIFIKHLNVDSFIKTQKSLNVKQKKGTQLCSLFFITDNSYRLSCLIHL